jgi:hypothetical protein
MEQAEILGFKNFLLKQCEHLSEIALELHKEQEQVANVIKLLDAQMEMQGRTNERDKTHQDEVPR